LSSESLNVSSVKQEIDLKPMISKSFNATNQSTSSKISKMSDNNISQNLNEQFNQSIKATMDDNNINDGNLIDEGAYDEN